jgi:hypothetical protein
LIDIWRSLAEGPPIDEQRALRQAAVQVTNNRPIASKDIVLSQKDSDDEGDPNDTNPFTFGPSGDPYEDLEDDDDEY